MAEITLDEGLDYILGVVAKGQAVGALAIGAFTSQTPTTVPARGATLGNGGIVEPAAGSGGYARVAMGTGDWGAPATVGNGRRITGGLKAFPASSSAWSPSQVNGCFIGVGAVVGAGVVILAANFDDNLPAQLNAGGLVLRTTPFWQLDG